MKGQVPEGKEKVLEGKDIVSRREKREKEVLEAFPFGESGITEGNKKSGLGDRIPSGQKEITEGKERSSSEMSKVPSENGEIPSEKKEEGMDEETKNTIGGLKKELGEVKEESREATKNLAERIEAIKKSNPPQKNKPSETATEETPLTAGDVERIIADREKREQMEKQKQVEEKGVRGRLEGQEERIGELEKYRAKCEKEGDAVACARVAMLEKKDEERAKIGEIKPEIGSLDKMTPEKRKTLTEEQEKERTRRAQELMNKFNVSYQDAWNWLWGSVQDRETIKGKVLGSMSDEDFEKMITSQPEDRKGKLVEITCKDGVCKAKYEEAGYVLMKKEDFKKEIEKKVQEERDKGPHI